MITRVEGDPCLRSAPARVDSVDPTLLKDMFTHMKISNAVGLAANQVGLDMNFFVAEYDGERVALANPRIYSYAGLQYGPEGCLSIPGLFVDVERPNKVEVNGIDLFTGKFVYHREFEGFMCRIVCHEIDHLNGRLISDGKHYFDEY